MNKSDAQTLARATLACIKNAKNEREQLKKLSDSFLQLAKRERDCTLSDVFSAWSVIEDCVEKHLLVLFKPKH